MLFRQIRNAVLLSFALSFAVPPQIEAQTKKKTTASARKRAPAKRTGRRPARRNVRPRGPVVPAVRYSITRSAEDLKATLGSLTARVQSGTFGIMVISVTRGDTLFANNAGVRMMPASTLKLLTSAIAFERLGPNYQFSTDALRDGEVSADGTLNGNLYIRGDGDPALSGKFLPGGSGAPMSRLAEMVATQGIKRITGSVIGDASGFDAQKIPEGWLTRYLQASYAARVSALSLNENLVAVAVSPGAPGRPANVTLEPSTSSIPLVNAVRTVGGGGASLGFRKRSDGTIEARGSIGSRSGTRKYVYIVEDPASFTTGAFNDALKARGITIDGAIRVGNTPADAKKVASLLSPPLASMVAVMNRESINHYAELIFRNAARGPKRDVQGSAANARALLRSFFASTIKTDSASLYFADGSGLSTLNRITPRAMTQMLSYSHRASWGPWLHSSLPVAGDSELLRRRMRNTPAEGNLHAKTGTTNDVIALAGYVTAANGEVIAFTFLYNGRDRWSAKAMIDVMSETLAGFGR